jgi:hypothetical protein
LWRLTFSSIWLVFDRYRWVNPSNNPGEGIPLDPLPTYTPPYTASADGTIISGGTGSVTMIDGVWQFGSVSGNGWNLQLNGIPVTAGYLGTGGLGGVTPFSLIEVNAHGQLFAQGADGVADGGFLQWVAQEIQLGPVTVPSSPVPVDMRFNPPCPNLSLSSPVGTYLTTVEVQMSDGSTFAGSYTIGASISGVIAGTSGNNLVTIVSPIPGSSGQAEYFAVTATQNGCSVWNILNFLTVT